jgi:hypothetical protein
MYPDVSSEVSLTTNVMKGIVHARRTRIVQVKEEAFFFYFAILRPYHCVASM